MLRRLRVALLVLAAVAGSALVGLGGTAAAVSVSTEAELQAAFATETQIDVQADIVLTDCTGGGAVERMAAVTDPVTIDGHGHTIRQTCTDNVFLQDGSGLFTANVYQHADEETVDRALAGWRRHSGSSPEHIKRMKIRGEPREGFTREHRRPVC